MGMQTSTATMKDSVDVPQKAHTDMPQKYNFTTLHVLPKGIYILIQKNFLTNVHCGFFHNDQILKTSNMSIN